MKLSSRSFSYEYGNSPQDPPLTSTFLLFHCFKILILDPSTRLRASYKDEDSPTKSHSSPFHLIRPWSTLIAPNAESSVIPPTTLATTSIATMQCLYPSSCLMVLPAESRRTTTATTYAGAARRTRLAMPRLFTFKSTSPPVRKSKFSKPKYVSAIVIVLRINVLTRCLPARSTEHATEPVSASPASSARAGPLPHKPFLDIPVDKALLTGDASQDQLDASVQPPMRASPHPRQLLSSPLGNFAKFILSITAAAFEDPAPAEEAPAPVAAFAAPAPGERPVLKPNTDYIVSDSALDETGVVMHIALHVLRCCRCLKHLTSGTLKGHMASHKFRISSDAFAAAMNVCATYEIHSIQKNVLTPRPMGPPVQALPSVIGYVCAKRGCGYGAVNLDTMVKHERTAHKIQQHGEGASGRPKVTLQTLFNNPEVYFVINPALPACANPDVVQHLSENFIPIACQPPPILTPSDDHGRSPLEIHCGFDNLLLAVRESRGSLQHLGSLKAMAKADEDGGLYIRLNGTVASWYDLVPSMLDGNPVHYDLQRVMFHGRELIPRSRYVLSQLKIPNFC